MKKYKKKPITIEAIQWPGKGHPQVDQDIGYYLNYFWIQGFFDFIKPLLNKQGHCKICEKSYSIHGSIQTLEGEHIVCPGDWVIKGIKGEFYPCKPDIFEKTYDLVVS